jgi:hypothetical protein
MQKPRTAIFLYLQKIEISNIPRITKPAFTKVPAGKNEFKKMPPINERQMKKKIRELVIYRALIYKSKGEEENKVLFAN